MTIHTVTATVTVLVDAVNADAAVERFLNVFSPVDDDGFVSSPELGEVQVG